jgi:hypothetical protein
MSSDKPNLDQETVCEHEAARDTRRLRHWIIKGVFVLISFIVMTTVIALMYDFVFRQGAFNESLVGGFFTSLIKLLEIIFSAA